MDTLVFMVAAHECNYSFVPLWAPSAYICIGSLPCNNLLVTLNGRSLCQQSMEHLICSTGGSFEEQVNFSQVAVPCRVVYSKFHKPYNALLEPGLGVLTVPPTAGVGSPTWTFNGDQWDTASVQCTQIYKIHRAQQHVLIPVMVLFLAVGLMLVTILLISSTHLLWVLLSSTSLDWTYSSRTLNQIATNLLTTSTHSQTYFQFST